MYYAFVVFGGESSDPITEKSKQERCRESDKGRLLGERGKNNRPRNEEIQCAPQNNVDECFERNCND